MPTDLQSRRPARDSWHFAFGARRILSWLDSNAAFVFWTVYLALMFLIYASIVLWWLY